MNYKTIIAIYGQDAFRKHYNDISRYVNLVNYDDYTPEVIEKIKNLYDAGKIDSYPRKNASSVEWIKKPGVTHRSNDLPAMMWNDGSKRWNLNGQDHRDAGAAGILYGDDGRVYKIDWYLNGKLYADETIDESGELRFLTHVDGYMSGQEAYVNVLKKYFPNAPESRYFLESYQ